MKTTRIKGYAEFQSRLHNAIATLERYEKLYPGELSLNGLRRQLEALDEWSSGGTPPTLEQKSQLNFGLLAIYCLAPIDRALEDELHELSDYLRKWR